MVVSSPDIDECVMEALNTCDDVSRAVCTNNIGSFECDCRAGFSGDGHTCIGMYVCVVYVLIERGKRVRERSGKRERVGERDRETERERGKGRERKRKRERERVKESE